MINRKEADRKDSRMTKEMQSRIFTVMVFSALALGSLQFVGWISRMAFENTCITLQEQHIRTEVSEVVDTIENSVNFGKELENYYGMDELLAKACEISDGNIDAAVLDGSGEPLYLSFADSDKRIELLSQIYTEEYQAELSDAAGNGIMGERVSLGDYESIVFPLHKQEEVTAGYFLVIYRQSDFLEKNDFSEPERAKWIIWAAVSIFLCVFLLRKKGKKRQMRYLPVAFIMAGMLVNIIFMYQAYKDKYFAMVSRNAESAAVYLQESVEKLLEKGLPVESLAEISDYLNQKAEGNAAIESIAVVKNYYSTNEGVDADKYVLSLEAADGAAQLDVVVSRSYIMQRVLMMTLTFGAVLAISLMLTYELTNLAEIISARADKAFNQKTKRQMEAVGIQVKILSFLTYMAIYASMSYTAVVMRKWNASLFGLSEAVSASLPLTVELLCIMLCSAAAQKIFKDMSLKKLLLFVFSFLIPGNMACICAASPYVLLALRAFCGMGFGFLKYWLNSIVSAGSEDMDAVGRNYAQLNAGMLGGITVGASLGSILAQSMGYQFNYLFTGLLCAMVMGFSMFAIPWRMLDAERLHPAGNAGQQSVRIKDIFRDRALLKAILLGAVPLNIGLMYVVAFMPVYMDSIGEPAIITSYAYLVNGIAGVYLGTVMVGRLKKFSGKLSVTFAMLTAAAGILILVPGPDTWTALLSAAVMGLFDGYGTPVITSFFACLAHVQKADTAGMLTVFNSVGGAVQIVCPMLYNMLILQDGSTLHLFLFGICYVVLAISFSGMFRKKE